jgi:hypothetical protein
VHSRLHIAIAGILASVLSISAPGAVADSTTVTAQAKIDLLYPLPLTTQPRTPGLLARLSKLGPDKVHGALEILLRSAASRENVPLYSSLQAGKMCQFALIDLEARLRPSASEAGPPTPESAAELTLADHCVAWSEPFTRLGESNPEALHALLALVRGREAALFPEVPLGVFAAVNAKEGGEVLAALTGRPIGALIPESGPQGLQSGGAAARSQSALRQVVLAELAVASRRYCVALIDATLDQPVKEALQRVSDANKDLTESLDILFPKLGIDASAATATTKAVLESISQAAVSSTLEVAPGTTTRTTPLETTILQGIVEFVVERAKQELVNYVASEFSRKLCNKKLVSGEVAYDVRSFFPDTCRLLGANGDEPLKAIDVSALDSAFRSALRSDLDRLPEIVLTSALAGPPGEPWPQAGVALYSVLKGLERGDNAITLVATILAQVKTSPCQDATWPVRLTGLALGAAVTAQPEANGLPLWHDLDLDKLDEVAAFLKLWNKRLRDVVGSESDGAFKTWASCKVATLEPDKAAAPLRALGALQAIKRTYDDLHHKPGPGETRLSGSEREERIAAIVSNVSLAMEQGFAAWSDGGDQSEKLAELLRATVKTWQSARARNYPDLIANLYALADSLEAGNHRPLPEPILRYQPLILALASAEKPEDVTAALEKAAAPLGAWSGKQDAFRTISLTAFVGVTAGAEYDGSWAGHLAVFAPIGLDVAWGRKDKRSLHNLGVFLSLIDVGTLAALRIEDGKAEVPSDVGVKEMFSPGVYYRKAIVRTPITWGVGGSWLTSRSDENVSQAWRVNAFVAIDVTILNLSRKEARGPN